VWVWLAAFLGNIALRVALVSRFAQATVPAAVRRLYFGSHAADIVLWTVLFAALGHPATPSASGAAFAAAGAALLGALTLGGRQGAGPAIVAGWAAVAVVLMARVGASAGLPFAAWLAAVAGTLETGLALFVDYGFPREEYYRPARSMGTLRCHYRHRAHDDPLILPGLQDLTASVDFSQLAEAGRRLGFDVACFASQSAFLIACGLPRILAEGASLDPLALARLGAEVRMLTLPGEMGERFQVLALSRGLDPRSLPFACADRSDRL
jgi:hypothetical protein